MILFLIEQINWFRYLVSSFLRRKNIFLSMIWEEFKFNIYKLQGQGLLPST